MLFRRRWRAVYYCCNCNKKLRRRQVYKKHGVCVYCGYVSKGTVCDTNKRSVLK